MNLTKHINDLLYRYDCVIIPDFGGFIANKISAKIDDESALLYPPTKKISFNSYLKHNDGLLVNHIATIEKINFKQANILISGEIASWKKRLNDKEVNLEGLGCLFLNREKQICFEPQVDSNFLISSFGLSSVCIAKIEREEFIRISSSENESVLESTIHNNISKPLIPSYFKYAASVAVLLVLGVVGYQFKDNILSKNNFSNKQKQLEQRIQQATFLISEPLPLVDLKPAIKPNDNKYSVVAGAFKSLKNAKKKVKQLQKKGYKASLIGKNKWKLQQVAYQSFETQKEAAMFARKIRKNSNNGAWVLTNKTN